MARNRVFGILSEYEDQNDHDALHSDAVFKLLANRLPDDDDFASQYPWKYFHRPAPQQWISGVKTRRSIAKHRVNSS